MWQTFKDLFEQRNNVWQLLLKTKFTNICLKGRWFNNTFFQITKKIINQLASINKQVEEDDFIWKIINSFHKGMTL
jgi:hypothetical protein